MITIFVPIRKEWSSHIIRNVKIEMDLFETSKSMNVKIVQDVH